MNAKRIRFRGEGYNPNHNIWLNNGTWFVHFTVYPSPVTKERVRRSLNTKNVVEARKRRDALLRRLPGNRRASCSAVELALAA